MNTRLIFVATAFGLMCNFAYGLEPAPVIEHPTQYRTMDRGMFENQTFNKMDNDARFIKFREVLRADPDLVPFVEVVKFEQTGDTLVITGVVNSEATKA